MTMNKVVKKLNNRGVTLIELLVTVVLLIIVTGMISLAVDFGVRSFNRSNRQAEGQILCAALVTAVKDELRYAKNIQGDDLSTLDFFSTNLSMKNCSFSITDIDGTSAESGGFIMLRTSQGKQYDLIAKQTYVYGLKATFTLFERDSTQPNPSYKVGIRVMTQDNQPVSEEIFVVEILNR